MSEQRPTNDAASPAARPPGLIADEAEPEGPAQPLDRPDPAFEILGVRPLESAATPTLAFAVRATDLSGIRIYTAALSVLFTVEPGKRTYEPEERVRLVELFGAPERWASTTGAFRWSQVDVLVPSFTGETHFEIRMPCTFDHEIAATKYFGGLTDGVAPLQLHFNGTVFYEGSGGRLQLMPMPWDRSVRSELPLGVWRAMIDHHYPHGAWVRVGEETLRRLTRLKADRGRPTFEAAVSDLLDAAGEPAAGGEAGGHA